MLRLYAVTVLSYVKTLSIWDPRVHGGPAGNPRRTQGPAVCAFIGMPSFLESRNTGVSQLPTWENVGGFIEMACADGSVPAPGAVSPRRLWLSALSQSQWPSAGARWHVPALRPRADSSLLTGCPAGLLGTARLWPQDVHFPSAEIPCARQIAGPPLSLSTNGPATGCTEARKKQGVRWLLFR